MAIIFIGRAEPFKRGDMSIQVLIDGKKAGTLFANRQLQITVPPGEHLVQASMSAMRGEKMSVSVEEDTELYMQVSGTRIAEKCTWSMLIWAFFIAIPLPYFRPKLLILGLVVMVEAYRWQKLKGTMFRLSIIAEPGHIMLEPIT